MIINYTHNEETLLPEISVENFNYMIITRLISNFDSYFSIEKKGWITYIFPKKYKDLYIYKDSFIAKGKRIGDIEIKKSTLIRNVLSDNDIFLNFFGNIIKKDEYEFDSANSISYTKKIISLNTDVETKKTFQRSIYIKKIYYESGLLRSFEEAYKKW